MVDPTTAENNFFERLPKTPIDFEDNPEPGKYWVQIMFHGMVGFVLSEGKIKVYVLNNHESCYAVHKDYKATGAQKSDVGEFNRFCLHKGCTVKNGVTQSVSYDNSAPIDVKKPSDPSELKSLFWIVDFYRFVNNAALKSNQELDAESSGSFEFSGVFKVYSLEGRDHGDGMAIPSLYKGWDPPYQDGRAIARSVVIEFLHQGDFELVFNGGTSLSVPGDGGNVLVHVINYDAGCTGDGRDPAHFKEFNRFYVNEPPVDDLINQTLRVFCLNEACPPALLANFPPLNQSEPDIPSDG